MITATAERLELGEVDMKIETFRKADEIQGELFTLKVALTAMYSMDNCGMASTFDINSLPETIKDKIKPIFEERIEKLEKEFEEL